MAINSTNIISMVESMPIDMKTKLVETLLSSIHSTSKEIDVLWANEAEVRVSEITLGKVQTIPGEQVFDEIRQKFSK
jgi:putative addiction module component (TIGR02574 family)